MSDPHWKLEENYRLLTLSFPSSPPIAMKMEVRGIEEFLKNLGELRYAMKPEIPKTFARGQQVAAVPDPAWVTEPDVMQGNNILHIRDPRAMDGFTTFFRKMKRKSWQLCFKSKLRSRPSNQHEIG